MSRIIEYIENNGNLDFKQLPFNQVDAAILTQLPLLDLSGVFEPGDTSIRQAYKNYMKLENDKERRESLLIYRRIHNIFRHLSEKSRYKDLRISDYIEIIDRDNPCQFSALSIHLEEEILICFSGTDDSVVGWHEDFLLLYLDKIPSHDYGLKYLENICEKYNNDIILCGHSKGANIAMNTILYTKRRYAKRVKKVYCYDGPGINRKEFNNEKLKSRFKKMISYIPYRSSIGKLFDHYEEYKIVECSANLLFQHDISTWHVYDKDFVYKDCESQESIYLDTHVKKLISELDDSSREIFVNALFNIMYLSEVKTFRDALKYKGAILKNMFKLKREEKKLLYKIFFSGMLKDSKIRKMLFSILKEKKKIE